jgi:hypothetical protein
MAIFHGKAYEVACNGSGAGRRWFQDLKQLANALDKLSLENRCDALFADRLIRLNSDRQMILPFTDRLIEQGALAAIDDDNTPCHRTNRTPSSPMTPSLPAFLRTPAARKICLATLVSAIFFSTGVAAQYWLIQHQSAKTAYQEFAT